jgi:hypothetical protein
MSYEDSKRTNLENVCTAFEQDTVRLFYVQ